MTTNQGTTFSAFAATVLSHRADDGIRGIVSERNRFLLHIEPAVFASKPIADIWEAVRP